MVNIQKFVINIQRKKTNSAHVLLMLNQYQATIKGQGLRFKPYKRINPINKMFPVHVCFLLLPVAVFGMDAFSKISASEWTTNDGTENNQCGSCASGQYLASLNSLDHVSYANVDFKKGATTIVMRVAGFQSNKDNAIMVSLDDTLCSIVTIPIRDNGGVENFYEVERPLASTIKGVHTVWLIPMMGNADPSRYVGNIDWFYFKK